LLKGNCYMSRELRSIVDAIRFEYHSESRSIKTMKIISFLTQRIGIQILVFGSERDDFEYRFADDYFFRVDELYRLIFGRHIQRTTGSRTGKHVFDSRINAIAAGEKAYLAILTS